MKQTIIQWLTTIVFLVSPALTMAETLAPDAFVQKTIDEVLEVIKSDKDVQAGDLGKIILLAEAKILPYFDFETMSKLVLGKNWRTATKDQRQSFTREFRSLLLYTYASALSKYKNQAIDYKPSFYSPSDTKVWVKTEIQQSGSMGLSVNYFLKKTNDTWKVIDISIDGISLIVNYRGQINSELEQVGMDGLIQRFAQKNKSNSTVAKEGNNDKT